MPKTLLEYEYDHILIVEGYSDLVFCVAFLEHLGRLPGVYVKVFEGKSKILNRRTLGLYLDEKRLAEKKMIGILLDADDNPAGTVQSARDRLRELTSRDLDEGQWQEGQPRLGFFVAPAADTAGEIETLAWNAFPDDEKHRAMKASVTGHLDQMEALGWKAHSPDKGRIAAYLAAAWDEDPRLGPGAREKKFPFEAEGFSRLRKFLEAFPISS